MMKGTRVLLAVVVCALFAVSYGQITCGGRTCLVGDQCCPDLTLGDTCYNPSTSDCVNGNRICGKGEGACNRTVCYDRTQYACINNNTTLVPISSTTTLAPTTTTTTTPAPTTTTTTTTTTTRPPTTTTTTPAPTTTTTTTTTTRPPTTTTTTPAPTTTTTTTTTTRPPTTTTTTTPPTTTTTPAPNVPCSARTCPTGDGCCDDLLLGGTCYNTTTSDCVNGNRLCGKGEGVCNRTVCYNRNYYNCVDNTLVPIPQTTTTAAPTTTTTAAPTTTTTTTTTTTRPPTTTTTTPAPTTTTTTTTTTTRPPTTTTTTPAPTTTTTTTTTTTRPPTTTTTTPAPNPPCSARTCPTGNLCCDDIVIGSICYNTTTSDCVNGNRLCGKGEGVCNSTVCYDKTRYSCVNNGLVPITARLKTNAIPSVNTHRNLISSKLGARSKKPQM